METQKGCEEDTGNFKKYTNTKRNIFRTFNKGASSHQVAFEVSLNVWHKLGRKTITSIHIKRKQEKI